MGVTKRSFYVGGEALHRAAIGNVEDRAKQLDLALLAHEFDGFSEAFAVVVVEGETRAELGKF